MFNNAHHIVEKLIELCFPSSPESLLVRDMSESEVQCYASYALTDRVRTLSRFNEHRISALIHEAKFHRNTRAQQLLAQLLFQPLRVEEKLRNALWIPIPLSPLRMRSRGYNQAREVLRHAEMFAPIRVRDDVLARTRDTKPQTELPRSERLVNVRDAFCVKKPDAIRNQDVVLVDDVMTTGSTLRAAEAALLPHEPRSVTLIALAH